MKQSYVASFFTELGALEFFESVTKLGDEEAKMVPVPRKISVSCGTGVLFFIPFDEDKMNNPDLDCIYRVDGDVYTPIWSQDD